jgi:hypothetical protein
LRGIKAPAERRHGHTPRRALLVLALGAAFGMGCKAEAPEAGASRTSGTDPVVRIGYQ